MPFSRKSLLKHSKRPLHAASRAFNLSTLTASRVLNVTTPAGAAATFAKVWVRGTNKTSSLLRRGLRRAYSSSAPGSGGPGDPFDPANSSSLPFYRKLVNAWTQTPTKWYPLPIAVGALLLVVIQYRKNIRRAQKMLDVDEDGMEVIRLKGPWQVHVLGALPLRNMSRLWGWTNSLQLPVWLRPFGYRLYAFAFGCNLDEIDPADLTAYRSLGDFFYRKLKDGARPIDAAILVSPADGKILHFGAIKDLRVEQVKGMTYSLDALLGVERSGTPVATVRSTRTEMDIVNDQEFANVNGIDYTLGQLIGGTSSGASTPTTEGELTTAHKFGEQTDASVVSPDRDTGKTLAHDTSVALEMGVKPSLSRRPSASRTDIKDGHSLFFAVIYLAPGDYHRFHSPTAWVAEKRRHFVGDLFSVSPYIAKRLENLFVLNERVALLGRWRHGFFSMVPVGATNVGSIKINFDQELRTNVRGRRPPPGTYIEAVYSAASPILNGQPLSPGEEMGGFCLGSTIVLVFEAPDDFNFTLSHNEKVRVGQRMGEVAAKTPNGAAKP